MKVLPIFFAAFNQDFEEDSKNFEIKPIIEGCGPNTIAIKRSAGNRWASDNVQFICDYTDDNYIVDLVKVHYNGTERSAPLWLYKNGIHVDFPRSFPMLERSHLIGGNMLNEIIRLNPPFMSVKIGKIISDVNNNFPSNPNQWDNDKYDTYCKLYVPSGSTSVQAHATRTHSETQPYFSVPTLKAIFSVNNLGPSDDIEVSDFTMSELFEGKNVAVDMTVIRVGGTKYYNFSKEPTHGFLGNS